MPSIDSKIDMYDLLIRGRLGNTLELWANPEDMIRDQYVGPYAIRCKLPQREFLPNLQRYGNLPSDNSSVVLEWDNYLQRNRLQPNMAMLAVMDVDGGRRTLTGELTRYPFCREGFVIRGYKEPKGNGYVQHNTVYQVEDKQSSLLLHYSFDDKLYRDAMSGINDRATLTGMEADSLLRQRVDPGDYDCLMELLDTYEDAIVEFTCFEKRLGIFNRRMVVWECRSKY